MRADRGVGREDWGVEVLAAVVASCASAGPLEDNRVVGVGRGDVDDLADTVDRSCACAELAGKVGWRGERTNQA